MPKKLVRVFRDILKIIMVGEESELRCKMLETFFVIVKDEEDA